MSKPVGGKDFPVFFQRYVDHVAYHEAPNSMLLKSLEDFKDDMSKLQHVDLNFAYAVEKWNIGQLIRHCIDTERIFAYRALCISRKEPAPIRSFDENTYAEAAGKLHHHSHLLEEFYTVRHSSALFYENIDLNITGQYGNFENGNSISLTAMAYIIAGHWLHHKHVLQERYDVIF